MQTGSITPSSGYSFTGSTIKKIAGIVMANITFLTPAGLSINTDYHVGTISDGFRPSARQDFVCSGMDSNGQNITSGKMWINDIGQIWYRTSTQDSRYIAANVSYTV